MANDHKLGLKVNEMLKARHIETPTIPIPDTPGVNWIEPTIEGKLRDILKYLGMDLTNDSLIETPHRVAKMYCQEIFTGLDYANFPKCTTIENGMTYDEMIACKASVMSVCEHHLVPFIGSCHVAYIPNQKVVGLSKINRITDFFSRRPQVQERLTLQIAETLKYILETEDVAVVIKAEHLCVKLRGVKDANSETITSKMSGKFMSNQSLRAEFLSLTR
jgi:GTP cyclohydrolase I